MHHCSLTNAPLQHDSYATAAWLMRHCSMAHAQLRMVQRKLLTRLRGARPAAGFCNWGGGDVTIIGADWNLLPSTSSHNAAREQPLNSHSAACEQPLSSHSAACEQPFSSYSTACAQQCNEQHSAACEQPLSSYIVACEQPLTNYRMWAANEQLQRCLWAAISSYFAACAQRLSSYSVACEQPMSSHFAAYEQPWAVRPHLAIKQ